jgi:predicted permease
MAGLVRDLRFAVRMLAKSPGFTAAATLTLALGIGAGTAIFSVVSTTFLRSLPYAESDRIALLSERTAEGDTPVAYPDFRDWQEQQDVFSALAFYRTSDSKLRTPEGVELVRSCVVSADFFSALGVGVAEGRDLAPADDQAGASLVTWVTAEARQRYLPGDSSPVGRQVVLDGQPVTVAGVLPTGFRFHDQVDFYQPVAPLARQLLYERENRFGGAYVLGRLRPGATLAAAQAQMSAIAARLEREYPKLNTGIGVRVVPLRESLAGAARPQLMLLLGAVGMVLLIACVNVASMLLARSFARQRELAVRVALGATRLQLARQLLVESVALAALGGLAGVALGLGGYRLVLRLVPAAVQRAVGSDVAPDVRVLLFGIAVSLITGIVFGLVPAWQSSHGEPNDALKTGRRTMFGRIRLGDLMVVAQVAVALTLLVGAGLLIRSLQQLLRVPSGLRPERVLTVLVEPPAVAQFARDPQSYVTYFERVLESVRPLPGVEAAAVTFGLPFAYISNSMPIYRDDQPLPRPGEFPTASSHTVTPDYFRIMGIPLLRGRVFHGGERPYALPPGVDFSTENFGRIFNGVLFDGVVSQRMAARYWPGEDPVGKRFRIGPPELQGPWVQIVGVVGSTTQLGLEQGETTEFYLSLRQWPVPAPMHLVVRTPMDPTALAASIRRAVQAAVSDAVVRDVQLMSERIDGFVSGREFNMGLFTFFAGAALLLSLIGLYGVLSLAVGQRSREIGIQMALGAERREVLREVLVRGLKLQLPGVLIGLGGAWGVGRLLQSSLFGVTGSDPATYVCSAGIFLLTGFLACVIPARRAAKVDPMVVLRRE